MNGTAQEFQKMAGQYNQMMMDSWSNWTKQTIQSESFTTASGAFMDWSLTTHKMMTDLSGQVMESLDIPRRSDLARISAQVQSVETRILEQEDAQEDIRELLVQLSQKLDGLKAAAPVPTPAPATAPVAKTEKRAAPAAKSTPKAAAKPKKKAATRKKAKARKASKK